MLLILAIMLSYLVIGFMFYRFGKNTVELMMLNKSESVQDYKELIKADSKPVDPEEELMPIDEASSTSFLRAVKDTNEDYNE